jgi:hypothetical protein
MYNNIILYFKIVLVMNLNQIFTISNKPKSDFHPPTFFKCKLVYHFHPNFDSIITKVQNQQIKNLGIKLQHSVNASVY